MASWRSRGPVVHTEPGQVRGAAPAAQGECAVKRRVGWSGEYSVAATGQAANGSRRLPVMAEAARKPCQPETVARLTPGVLLGDHHVATVCPGRADGGFRTARQGITSSISGGPAGGQEKNKAESRKPQARRSGVEREPPAFDYCLQPSSPPHSSPSPAAQRKNRARIPAVSPPAAGSRTLRQRIRPTRPTWLPGCCPTSAR